MSNKRDALAQQVQRAEKALGDLEKRALSAPDKELDGLAATIAQARALLDVNRRRLAEYDHAEALKQNELDAKARAQADKGQRDALLGRKAELDKRWAAWAERMLDIEQQAEAAWMECGAMQHAEPELWKDAQAIAFDMSPIDKRAAGGLVDRVQRHLSPFDRLAVTRAMRGVSLTLAE